MSEKPDEEGETARPPSRRDRRIRHVFRYATDAILLLDPRANAVLDANERACELFGYAYEELVSLPISTVHPDALSTCKQFVRSVNEEGVGWTDRLPCVTKSGERIPSEIAASTIDVEGETCLISSVRPVETGHDRAGVAADRELSEGIPRELETLLRTHERELERLERLNDLVRSCQQCLAHAATRREVESVVCSALSDVDRYVFAWIGEHDPEADVITPRAWSDTEAGFVDGLSVPVGDPPTKLGPLTSAVRTGEVHVSQHIADDAAFEPFREEMLAREFRSGVAIPLRRQGMDYGVLGVYADRLHAFSRKEQTVLGELGDVIAARIAALERKAALLADEVVRLEFETSDGELLFVRLSELLDCPVELDAVTGQSEASIHVHCRLDADAVDPSLAERVPSVEGVDRVGDRGGDAVVRVTLDRGAAVLPDLVAEHGGKLCEATAEAGAGRFVVERPASLPARPFVELIRTRFPDTTLAGKRERGLDGSTRGVERVLDTELTDRQREVLERAYEGGYFEERRRQTATEIAASLEVSQSAFNQTLRRAQRNLLAALFDGG